MTKQREFKIDAEHLDKVRELSQANNHATIRAQLAGTRYNNLMRGAAPDDDVIAAFDLKKSLGMAAFKANEVLWDFLKSIQWKIKDDPDCWALANDDETLIYTEREPQGRQIQFPQPGRN